MVMGVLGEQTVVRAGRDGWTRPLIMAGVRAGELVCVRPGRFVAAGVGRSPEDRHRHLVAATFAELRPGAVLSHASAAVWHGLPVPLAELERCHVLRPGRTGGKRGRHLHVHRGEAAEDVVEIDGVPMTSLARTVEDLTRSLDPMFALAVADRAAALGVDMAEIQERRARAPRRPGNACAREVVGLADGRAESPGESWSRWRMHQAGVPMPELQRVLRDAAGDQVARVDFWWESVRLVGEFDGEIKYGRLLRPGQSVADVIRAEKAREEAIRRTGNWVVRWTAKDLFTGEFVGIMRDAWRSARPR